MQARFGAYVLFALFAAPMGTAAATTLPGIKTAAGNSVPQCVTPGRMVAFLKSRNPEFNPRYESLPGDYMRLGEALGVRWDFAFYQMVLETGALSFKAGGRAGDVKADQNNFAGLGATGKGQPGESFPDIATGVQAHLEHLLLYSGQHLDNPVADRTRKVQQWGVLTQWQAGFTRPITFADLAAKWAPGSNAYSKMLESIAQNFQDFCRRPDPKPELLAAARNRKVVAEAPKEPKEPTREPPPGNVLAKQAITDGKSEDNNHRAGLVSSDTVSPSLTASLGGKVPPTPFKVLNSPAPEPEAEAQPAAAPRAPAAWAGEPSPAFRSGMLNMPPQQKPPAFYSDSSTLPPPALPAAVETPLPNAGEAEAKAPAQPAPSATPPAHQAQKPQSKTAAAPPPPPRKDPPPTKVASAATSAVPAGQKCRVWTASYGGQKALIIRSVIDRVVNFTVLDVNEGAEKREADAFIAAYAKNGTVAGEYASQTNALDKAFELCPEG